jgi:hypothetical protein
MKRYVLLYLGVGAAEWTGLVALEARHNDYWSGDYYLLIVLFTALVFGIFDRRTAPLLAGFLLVAPALCLALWTAPQGDRNGLQGLWLPGLLVWALLADVCHRTGGTIAKAIKAK